MILTCHLSRNLLFISLITLCTIKSFSQSVFPSAVAANWSSLGPANIPGANGRIDFIRFAPNDSNTIWVGSRTGGLWKSVNAGVSWTTLTDNEPFIGCYDLAISNVNPDIMYMATGTVGPSGSAFDIGVKKTIDGGISWSMTNLSFSSCCDHVFRLEVNPDDNDVVLAATSDGIYMSIDGGGNWNRSIAGNFNDIKFKPGNSQIVYAVEQGLEQTRFFVSPNSGFVFNRITSGLPDSLTDVMGYKIAVTAANPDYVYLLANGQSNMGYFGVYRSIDGGSNFNAQSTSSPLVQINSGPDFMCIDINPFNADDVYIGGVTPYHSTDGGVNWMGTSFPNLSNDFHAMKFVVGSSTTIFAGSNGGFYKTDRSDSTWTYLSNGLQVAPMNRMGSAASSNLILVGQQGNGTLLYTNGSWNHLYEGSGGECIFDYANSSIMYISSPHGLINKSTNGGANFSTIVLTDSTGVNSNGSEITPFIMHPSDPNTLLVGKHEVYRTVDGGNSWNMIPGFSDSIPITALTYGKSNPDYIYATTPDKFFACTNGNTFMQRTYSFPGSITGIAVSSSDPEKVWISMSGFAGGNNVYATTDAGMTWNDYSVGLPNLPINCIVYQDSTDDALYVGMDVGVYYRSNSFSDWQYYSNSLPNVQVRELEIKYDVNKIRAATFGRGLWESDMVMVTGIEKIVNTDDCLHLSPNPSTGNLTMNNFTSADVENPEIEIYNELGVIVMKEKIMRDKFSITLSKGIYLAILSSDNNRCLQKLIVQ